MPKRKSKPKQTKTKKGAKPMPSLIFNEGTLQEELKEELKKLAKSAEPAPVDKNFETGGKLQIAFGYNPAADRLMWFGVISVAVVVFSLWSWSVASQFTSIKWNESPEKNLVESTVKNWQTSFDSADLKGEIKNNLQKIISGSTAVQALNAGAVSTTNEIVTTTTN